MGQRLLAACAILLASLPCVAATVPEVAFGTLGTRYHFGGTTPQTGFDCSGLVAHVYQHAWGVALPRNTQEQRRLGRPVKLSELKPGDLVFYDTRNRPYSHVGIYVGQGNFVHAPRRGATVRIESVNTRYWRSRFNGGRRLQPPAVVGD